MNYSSLTRTELTSLIEKQKIALLNIKCSSIRPDETAIAEAEKNIYNMLAALYLATISGAHTDTPVCEPDGDDVVARLMIRQQSLWNSMRDIKCFNPGNDIHHFITDRNQAYIINIKPDLAKYLEMED